ncbi:MAG: family 16 glycosylhydrolase [Chloroflexi bacterium]|nr:family 16 glycosylhydrolase [Chloroflexota bacterium]
MTLDKMKIFRHLEISGGQVQVGETMRLWVPNGRSRYTDAQIDDYGRSTSSTLFPRRHFPWRPGTHLKIRVRFSHSVGKLLGTAGFGFWNAPFIDPTIKWPALPQAIWFFYASEPTDLPFAPEGAGRGWFAGTLNARSGRAKALIPVAPFVVAGNQIPSFQKKVWPFIQNQLGISYVQLPDMLTTWHTYEIIWHQAGCHFIVDGKPMLETDFQIKGALGFVCWVDNQYMVVRENGRFRVGTLPLEHPQWMEISSLDLSPTLP